MINKEKSKTNCDYMIRSVKINNITVNVKSYFFPKKDLSDILFSIVCTQLKEKSA